MRLNKALIACLVGIATVLPVGVATPTSATVDRPHLDVRYVDVNPYYISPNGDGTLDSTQVVVSVGTYDAVNVRWWIETSTGTRTSYEGSISGFQPGYRQEYEFSMSPDTLADGVYRVRAEVTYADDPLWLYSGTSPVDSGGFSVDLTSPAPAVLKAITPTTFYPVKDEYRDAVIFDSEHEEVAVSTRNGPRVTA